MSIEYAVQIIWSPDDNAYLALTPELPGCMADGNTPEEALANVRVVIQEWLEVAREENRPIPNPMSLEDFARIQMQAQADLQNRIEGEVKKAMAHLWGQIMQQPQAANSWSFRPGIAFDPTEALGVSGGRR